MPENWVGCLARASGESDRGPVNRAPHLARGEGERPMPENWVGCLARASGESDRGAGKSGAAPGEGRGGAPDARELGGMFGAGIRRIR